MTNPDLLLYAVHVLFWTSFGVAGLFLKEPAAAPTPAAPAATETTAPYSRLVLAVHFLAFGLLYFALGNTIFPRRVPEWFTGQRVVGTIVILAGAA
ncbi:MAG TPA: hypothetical protein VF454_01655, partial [Gemmatimonadales bacterium]